VARQSGESPRYVSYSLTAPCFRFNLLSRSPADGSWVNEPFFFLTPSFFNVSQTSGPLRTDGVPGLPPTQPRSLQISRRAAVKTLLSHPLTGPVASVPPVSLCPDTFA